MGTVLKRLTIYCALFGIALFAIAFFLFSRQSPAPPIASPVAQHTLAQPASPGLNAPAPLPVIAKLQSAPQIAPVVPMPESNSALIGAIARPAALVVTGTPLGTTTIPILMYHYVRTVTNPRDILGKNLSVTPTLFAEQMQYLADKGYTTLTMHDVYEILSGDEQLPAKPVALTFDDGYLDFYTTAWPILQQHNFKATSYIITGFVGGSAYMSWDQIRTLDATGMVDFGAHTVNHLDLQLLGPKHLWSEIDGSKLALEQNLGRPVTDFDYPSGEYNSATIADVKKAGFETAVTTHYGSRQNLKLAFTMPRIRVTGPNGLKSWIASLPK